MGALTDFLTSQTMFDNSNAARGTDRIIKQYFDKILAAQGDPAVQATYLAKNELHQIFTYIPTVSGGTFAITINLKSGETFTTAGIAHDANAATVEGAIDTAATGLPVVGWTNGDIAVTGGPLASVALSLTYSGTSVANQNHPSFAVDDALLTGGGSISFILESIHGSTQRIPWSVMAFINVYGPAGPPNQGDIPLLNSVTGTPGSMYLSPPREVLCVLALQAAIDDENDAIEETILGALRDNGVAV